MITRRQWSAGLHGSWWLDYFFDDCKGCQIDFIPLHWYANDTAANFEAYLTQAHNRFQKVS